MAWADIESALFALALFVGSLTSIFMAIRIIVRLRKRTVSVVGTVIRLQTRGYAVAVPCPDVEFFDERGFRHEFGSMTGASWNPWPPGSQVRVSYDPDDPANAELALSNLGIPGLVFFVLGYIVTVGISLLVLGGLLYALFRGFSPR